MKTTLEQSLRVNAIWDDIEAVEPEISTERLIAMTAERARDELGGCWEASSVVDALELAQRFLKGKPSQHEKGRRR